MNEKTILYQTTLRKSESFFVCNDLYFVFAFKSKTIIGTYIICSIRITIYTILSEFHLILTSFFE